MYDNEPYIVFMSCLADPAPREQRVLAESQQERSVRQQRLHALARTEGARLRQNRCATFLPFNLASYSKYGILGSYRSICSHISLYCKFCKV